MNHLSRFVLRKLSGNRNHCKDLTTVLIKQRQEQSLHTNSVRKQQQNKVPPPRTPDLIYVPHFTRWLRTKLRFKYLQRTWDPEFTEGAFIFGTTQAICRITQIINSGQYDQFDGLVTVLGKTEILTECDRLTDDQKAIIHLQPDDIKIYIPMDVKFTRSNQKECTVRLRVVALKWRQHTEHVYRLVLVSLQTDFVRNYTSAQEWNMAHFKVLECAIIAEATTSAM